MKEKEQKFCKNPVLADIKFHKLTKKLVGRKKAWNFDEKFYQSLSRKLTNSKTVGQVLENDNTAGRCYFYALLTMQAMSEATLVHGNLNVLNHIADGGNYYEVFDHAWVECGGCVYDTTMKTCFDKEEYYKTFGVQETKTYSQEDLKDEKVFCDLAKKSASLHHELEPKLSLFPQFSKGSLRTR